MHWPESRELSPGRNSIFNAVLWLLIELLPSVQFLSKNSGDPPCLESSPDKSVGKAVLPTLSRGFPAEALGAQAQTLLQAFPVEHQ